MFLLWFGGIMYLNYFLIKTIQNANNQTNTKRGNSENTGKINFEDVGGCTEAKKAILDILDYIKNKEKYTRMGVKMPKGILLYGPPGTGKTLVAKAAATEAGMPVLYSSGSEFVELYVGMGAKRIRELFSQARKAAKESKSKSSLIFIDEIDAVGYQRKSKG